LVPRLDTGPEKNTQHKYSPAINEKHTGGEKANQSNCRWRNTVIVTQNINDLENPDQEEQKSVWEGGPLTVL